MPARRFAQGPSWFNSNYRYRWPIIVDGTADTGSVDVETSVPAEWDAFWNNVRSDGLDIVVTDADGVTVLSYDIGSFNKTNRTLTLQVDAWTLNQDNAMNVLWVYWGYDSEATDRTASVTITSALTGYIELAAPVSAREVLLPNDEAPGQGEARQKIAKAANDNTRVFWRVGDALARRITPYNGSYGLEGIEYVTGANVDPGITITNTSTRLVYDRRGALLVMLAVSGGSDGGDEVFKLTIGTDQSRTLEFRARALVEDLT